MYPQQDYYVPQETIFSGSRFRECILPLIAFLLVLLILTTLTVICLLPIWILSESLVNNTNL